jgi:hypothetical protein
MLHSCSHPRSLWHHSFEMCIDWNLWRKQIFPKNKTIHWYNLNPYLTHFTTTKTVVTNITTIAFLIVSIGAEC